MLTVPETMAANVLLAEFTKNRKTMALVVDEFGGTAGLVTVEDLVEEVFGEIEDEHDEQEEDDLISKKLGENTWLLSARHDVDDLNEEFHLGLPEGEYTTLGGLIMHFAESIPAEKEVVEVLNFRFTIMEGSDRKLTTVKLERMPLSSM